MELVDPRRAAVLATAPNAEVVRRRRDGRVVQINLLSFGEDHGIPTSAGHSQDLIHDNETATNPPRVWEFDRLDFADGA